jgi:hypothetical protein
MSQENPPTTHLDVQLPVPEASDLTTKAAQKGISTPEYLGYHVLRSAYGVMHPYVVAIDQRACQGNAGTDRPAQE